MGRQGVQLSFLQDNSDCHQWKYHIQLMYVGDPAIGLTVICVLTYSHFNELEHSSVSMPVKFHNTSFIVCEGKYSKLVL